MKRLNTRIEALEQRKPTAGTLSPGGKELLVEILARRDALFWPWRLTKSIQPPMTEIRLRQREYLSGVAGVSAKGSGTQADWKIAHELRGELITAGMLTAVNSGGQVTSVFLTPLGDGTSAALVGDLLASHRSGQLVFMLLQALTDERGTPVREHVLLKCPAHGDPSDWDHLTSQILPALVCGAARATPDTVGRVLFSFTKGAEMPDEVDVDIAVEPWAESVYLDIFDSERMTLSNLEPRDMHETFVPIGASDCWPTKETADEE